MRRLYVAVWALALGIGATPAVAARFSPVGAQVKIVGSFDIGKSVSSPEVQCNFALTGAITGNGKLKIKNARLCNRIQAYGLPWIWEALQAHHQPFGTSPMAFAFKSGYDCGSFNPDFGLWKDKSEMSFGTGATSKRCFIGQFPNATYTPANLTIIQ